MADSNDGVAVSSLKDVIRTNDVRGLMRHVEEHGLSAVREISGQVEAKARESLAAKEKQQQAFWATAPAELSPEQDALLATLPNETLRSQFRDRMRAGVIFEQKFRPVAKGETSFVGGLPVVGDTFIWPRAEQSGKPLAFVGQVDMKDLPDFGLRAVFPERGALLFFAPETHHDEDRLVQHFAMEDATEVAPPQECSSYNSCYQFAGFGTKAGEIGWLHEQGSELAPFSILPKWPLVPKLSAFAPRRSDFYDLEVPIPEELLSAHQNDPTAVYQTFSRMLNGVPEEVREKRELFDCFPHVWGAMADVAGRFLGLIEKCETIHGENTSPEVADLKKLVTSCLTSAEQAGFGTPVSPSDLVDLRNVIELMWAKNGVALPGDANDLIGPQVLNNDMVVSELLFRVQTYWVLSSMCHDPSTLPPEVVREFSSGLEASFSAKGHIQSLGHTHDVSGEETALHSVLLMQFPWSSVTDTTGVFGFDGLRFWMTYDDLENRRYEKVHCES